VKCEVGVRGNTGLLGALRSVQGRHHRRQRRRNQRNHSASLGARGVGEDGCASNRRESSRGHAERQAAPALCCRGKSLADRFVIVTRLADVGREPSRARERSLSAPFGIPTFSVIPAIGAEKLWAKFDKALDQLGVALEGDGFAQLAAVFGSLSAAANEIADSLDASSEIRETG
jgi:hypothetical protein